MRECLKKLKGKTVNVEGELKHISVCSNTNKNYHSERRNNYDKYVRVTIMNVKSAETTLTSHCCLSTISSC